MSKLEAIYLGRVWMQDVLFSIYRGQKLALNFFRRESCPQYRKLSSINRGQVFVLNKLRANFRPRYIEDKNLSSINRGQDPVELTKTRINLIEDKLILVLDLSKTGSCLGCIKNGVRSCEIPIIFSNFSTVIT